MITRLALFLLLPGAVVGAEARLMVAPQISMDEKVRYSEELANFYGTHLELLRSSVVVERVHAKHPEFKEGLEIRARQIPSTSILEVSVSGSKEEQNKLYLDALIEEFLVYKTELREKTFEMKLSRLTEALKKTESTELKKKIKEEALLIEKEKLTGLPTRWIRIK